MPNASPKSLATGPISALWGMAAKLWLAPRRKPPPPVIPVTSRMQPRTGSLPSTTRCCAPSSRPSKRDIAVHVLVSKAANRPPLPFHSIYPAEYHVPLPIPCCTGYPSQASWRRCSLTVLRLAASYPNLRSIRQCPCPEIRGHPAYKYSSPDGLFQINYAYLPAVNLP